MNGCGLLNFDAGECARATLLGWLPPWVWETFGFVHDYWQWMAYGFIAIVVIGTLYRVWLIFGMPGVIAVFGTATFILGFVLGKRSTVRVQKPNSSPGPPTVLFPGHPKPVTIKKPGHVKISDLPPPSLTRP